MDGQKEGRVESCENIQFDLLSYKLWLEVPM